MIAISQVPVKTFLSKSKIPGFDYVINPYIGCPHKCIYCYAEYMRKFTGHSEAWGDFLDVRHCDIPLPPAKLFHTHVLLSSVTDPYNPYEKQYELTRKLLKQLQYCQAYVHILTKSSLVTRDLDLFKQMPGCEVSFSFSSADDSFRQLAEPGASSVEEKINALRELSSQGIQTGVMVAPIFPGLTDWKEIILRTREYTQHYNFDSLNMRPAYRQKVLSFVAQHYPNWVPLYTDIFIHENTSYWQRLADEISTYCQQENIPADLYFKTAVATPNF
ncbi:MAG: radical SAM protein [Elusimicrobiaceae bacterium]|nr:radical SAM protein [Elusimicrobiaceae bacterium]